LVKANWLASPPLVIAYGLIGSIRYDISKEALGIDLNGHDVYLKDIWPTQSEIDEVLQKVNTEMFHKEYAAVFDGDESWQAIQIPQSQTYAWDVDSTYIRHPPFFENIDQPAKPIENIKNARILAILGDSVTTLEPGASELFTHGLRCKPFSTAFLASKPAANITLGFEVFVHEVIAEITTSPCTKG